MRAALILFLASLLALSARADGKSKILTAALAGAEFYDGISTRHDLAACRRAGYSSLECTETGAVARLLLGPHPSWSAMAGFGTMEDGGAHYLAGWMRRSPHRWLRDLWWAPQAGLITAHLYQGSGNFWKAASFGKHK